MSAGFDMSRVVRSWLREDEHDSADHVLEVVLSRLDATPQRRSSWPARREPRMNLYTRLAIGAAAALAAVFVGLRLLPAVGPTPGGSGAIATPTPSGTLAPSVASSWPPLPVSGPIEPGTYLVMSNTQTPFQVTILAGWSVQSGMIVTGDFYNGNTAALLRPWIVTHVYADACRWQGSMQPVGPAKAALVAALTAQTGREAEGPVDVMLGGLDAAKFVLSVPSGSATASCNDGYLRPFPGTGGNEDLSPPMFETSITTLYVVETGGKATAIQAAWYEGTPPADVSALEGLLDSIVFIP